MSVAIERIRLHRHCPRCGSTQVGPGSPQHIVCGACGLELYFNPCAAAGVILVDPEDHVLLVRRAHEPARGKLALPGGFIDDGESAEEGLRRELREEVGLEVGELRYLTSCPNTYPFAGVIYPTLDLYFVARVPDFTAATALDGVAGLVVQPAAAVRLEELAFDSLRAAWRVFLAASDRAG